jgi:hypothetical protein
LARMPSKDQTVPASINPSANALMRDTASN